MAEHSLDGLGVSLLPFLWFHFINIKGSTMANYTEHYPSVILQLFLLSFINKRVNLFSLLPNLWNFFNHDTHSRLTLCLPWTSNWFGSSCKKTYQFYFNMIIVTWKKPNQQTTQTKQRLLLFRNCEYIKPILMRVICTSGGNTA